jgi:hypothetical protein
MDKAAIQVALGIDPDLEVTAQAYAMIEYIELEEGEKIVALPSLSILEAMEGHVFSAYFVKEGDFIPKITHSAHRPACVLFKALNHVDLVEKIKIASSFVILNTDFDTNNIQHILKI